MIKSVKHIVPSILLILVSVGLAAGPYEPNWESLSTKDLPEWLLDAKFGVYTHWGVYSVPAHGGPDYIKNLYGGPDKGQKGVYDYHIKKYGAIKDFGYKDFIPMFTAPKFNADEWVGLMHEAGARFGGICLVHHDGFLLWDSQHSRWNSKNMGPKRDIYGEIAKAVRKYDDMKLLATFHHGRTFGYVTGFLRGQEISQKMRENWDVFDPEYIAVK
jgi:alpha-L-fucosidase